MQMQGGRFSPIVRGGCKAFIKKFNFLKNAVKTGDRNKL